MKMIILTLTVLASVSASALTDAEMNLSLNQAYVKADLYMCFKGANGGELSNSSLVDQIIMKDCSKHLEHAQELNISNEEILRIAKDAVADTQKSAADIKFEKDLNDAMDEAFDKTR